MFENCYIKIRIFDCPVTKTTSTAATAELLLLKGSHLVFATAIYTFKSSYIDFSVKML